MRKIRLDYFLLEQQATSYKLHTQWCEVYFLIDFTVQVQLMGRVSLLWSVYHIYCHFKLKGYNETLKQCPVGQSYNYETVMGYYPS